MNRYRTVSAIIEAGASKPGPQERNTRKCVLEVDDRKRVLEVDDRKRLLKVNDRKRVVEADASEHAERPIAAEPMSGRRTRKRISRSQRFKRRPYLVNDQ